MSDADTRNEDWLRTSTWDLYTPWHTLVTTLDDLKTVVGAAPEQIAHFLSLPAAEAMPEALLHEARSYAGTIPHQVESHQDEVPG